MREPEPERDGRPRLPAATTWVRRNPRRVAPVAVVQALVTALLVAVLTPTNVFYRTADAYIEPLRSLTIVTPQRKSDFDAALAALLDANPHLDRRLPAKMLWIDTPAIVGDLTSPLLALSPDDAEDLLRRLSLRLVAGRLPAQGTPGAAIHAALLRARGLALGDTFGRLADPDDETPGLFEVVGVLEGEARLGLIDLDYASIPDFVLARRPSFQVVYARPGEKDASDAYLRAAADPEGRVVFRVTDEAWARRTSERYLRNLPLLLGFLTAAVAAIVALVTALLHVIAFQARVDEFALYLALGHRRAPLVRKLVAETAWTAGLGWVAGLLLGVGVVALYDALLLAPKAIVIDVLDPTPFLFSLLVPVLSTLASGTVLARRLHRMDPVAVIQRRG